MQRLNLDAFIFFNYCSTFLINVSKLENIFVFTRLDGTVIFFPLKIHLSSHPLLPRFSCIYLSILLHVKSQIARYIYVFQGAFGIH